MLEKLIKNLANEFVTKVIKSVVFNIQKQQTQLLSDDAGLSNCWDEICVITQEGDNAYSDIIESTIDNLILHKIEVLKPSNAVLCALWLQTFNGQDWLSDHAHDQNFELTYNMDDVVEYIRDEVLSKAMNWTNKRIERYSDRQYEFDGGYF